MKAIDAVKINGSPPEGTLHINGVVVARDTAIAIGEWNHVCIHSTPELFPERTWQNKIRRFFHRQEKLAYERRIVSYWALEERGETYSQKSANQ